MSGIKFAHVVTIALAVGCAVSCRSGNPVSTAVVQAASEPAPAPSTARTTAAQEDDTYIASGPLVVDHQVELTAEREGTVEKIEAEPGKKPPFRVSVHDVPKQMPMPTAQPVPPREEPAASMPAAPAPGPAAGHR